MTSSWLNCSLLRIVTEVGEWNDSSGLKIFNSSLISSHDPGDKRMIDNIILTMNFLLLRHPAPDGGDQGGAALRDCTGNQRYQGFAIDLLAAISQVIIRTLLGGYLV
jgi:hypothetical protein